LSRVGLGQRRAKLVRAEGQVESAQVVG